MGGRDAPPGRSAGRLEYPHLEDRIQPCPRIRMGERSGFQKAPIGWDFLMRRLYIQKAPSSMLCLEMVS